MGPAPRAAKGSKAKQPSGRLATRFQPYRRAAPRPPRFQRFLDLPPELRTYIYRFFAEQPEAIDACSIWNERPKTGILSLLLSCRLINDEAAHVFYSLNTFCFLEQCDEWSKHLDTLDACHWHTWLRNIGPKNAASLRHVQLRIRFERPADYYPRMIQKLAERCPNITRLAIVEERHASVTSINGLRISSWEPNQVVPLKPCVLSALVPRIAMFDKLKLLVLAGPETKELLDEVCEQFRVRIQVVESQQARRIMGICHRFWGMKKLYDGTFVKESMGHPAIIARADGGGSIYDFVPGRRILLPPTRRVEEDEVADSNNVGSDDSGNGSSDDGSDDSDNESGGSSSGSGSGSGSSSSSNGNDNVDSNGDSSDGDNMDWTPD